ncbi:MAG TPA: sensor domain-containing diguanylate cyclase [Usitatibacter sp.]|nr:sensor domain-containing diguanylate cyclase [Usitatibacter sp.]
MTAGKKIPIPRGFRSAQNFVTAMADEVGGLISYVDSRQRVRYVSKALADWLGCTQEEAVGKTLSELYGPQTYAQFEAWTQRALAGEDVHYERQGRARDGSLVWLSVNLRPHRGPEGKVLGYFSCALEVEELKRTHDALSRALQHLASHIENTPLAVIEWSAGVEVMRWSPQAQAIFGWKADEVLGKRSSDIGLVHADSLETVRALTKELLAGVVPRNRMLAANNTKDGRTIWCQWYNSAVFDEHGKIASILSLAEDVTARVDAEEHLKKAAVHDALTGLPNRNSLAARLEHAIVRVNRSGDRLALLFIDLDRFKKVNDTLGHAAGDEVLRQAGARIRACVRDIDTVARLGGDEFVVLLETDVRPDTPGIIGERIRAAFANDFEWKGLGVRCGASVGVSLYPDHARDPAALLASADEAMYREKSSG